MIQKKIEVNRINRYVKLQLFVETKRQFIIATKNLIIKIKEPVAEGQPSKRARGNTEGHLFSKIGRCEISQKYIHGTPKEN